ncbi:hypothetical protein BKK81_26895 [Cupriavidus sp. USMAHM13]|uniref:Beta-ketoacyl synthase-like N-terminal domain-containing protein n=1 Tax=Cupriavidus malaysiensis TaxID=367825 RepID=A0ABM6FDJ2_9BURK|nr:MULTISPECIES: beta-ketoacyl synthase chain length factor [Cupriavidus]AOZ02807.1 hypothetical protein BKK81_26895 [Cupriavidus sp. USMAHM13]AOZ09821.1 hypothetical protein BKK80_29425 [Cupriavidus malaysiensis]
MAMEFGIRAWSARAGGLQAEQAWREWCAAPWLPSASAAAADLALEAMAPMLRRRVVPLGRVALAPAYECQAQGGGIPTVFASRHGDVQRAYDMLSDLAAEGGVSPTAFGLSVHNAIGALYAIDRKDVACQQAVAAGRDTVEAGVVEACALLADGAPEVLLVHYEAPLPEAYAGFADEPAALYGWAWRLGRPRAGEPVFSLAPISSAVPAAPASGPAPALPHGLEVLRFMLSGEAGLIHHGEQCAWQWRRHG